MSHHIYHTRGIILSSQPSGESNRFYKIFTEELGLIGGTAQSVREGKSKLRYVLQDLSLVTVDLVRGKEVWRIISAGAWDPLENIKSDRESMKIFARYTAFLERLIQGERHDKELFDEIVSVVNFLKIGAVPKELRLSFETLAIFRVMTHLGYMNPDGYEQFLEPVEYLNTLLEGFESVRIKAILKINDALDASHL